MPPKKSTHPKQGRAPTAPNADAALLAALGTPPTADEVPMMMAAWESGLDALGFKLAPSQMVEVAKRASAQADATRLKVLKSTKETPACCKGCSWCCSHKVGVTVPEVIAIVTYLKASPERLEIARQRAAELAQNPLIFSDSEKPRARIPCALLDEDGSCCSGARQLMAIGARSMMALTINVVAIAPATRWPSSMLTWRRQPPGSADGRQS